MKKTTALLCAAALLSTAAGCSQGESKADRTSAAVIETDKSYDYEVKELWCENNGKRIYGEAYIPKTDGKLPTVITSHGLGTNHESGASYAKKYAPKGIAVYTFDFCGGSNPNNPNKSDGSPKEMSVMTEVSDLDAVLNTAKTWDFVDTNRIFLQGGSQGGLVSAIEGVKRKDDIAGMILLYPAFGMYDFVTMYDPDEIGDEFSVASMTVGKNFVTDLAAYDVRSDLPSFDKPVIIIQGSDDDIVLPESSVAAAELMPDATYYLINGADHGFSGKYHDEATQQALEFLNKHI